MTVLSSQLFKSVLACKKISLLVVRSVGGIFLLTACILIVGYETVCAADSKSREYAVRGTLVSKVNFYDRSGNLTQPPKGVRAATESDFVFYRKDAKWRLNIEYLDPAFDKGTVWNSIMPLDRGGFVSVISFPPRPGVPESKGNEYVTIMTNQFLPAEIGHRPHAVWLAFTLDEIIESAACSNGCPPIWNFNPRLHDMRVNSHRVIRTNDGIIFWNTGRSATRDASGQVVLENGRPQLQMRPPPLDEGFVEADYRPSSAFLNQELGIPKSVVLKTWLPVRDEKDARGIRMVLVTDRRIENKKLESRSIPESVFVPEHNRIE